MKRGRPGPSAAELREMRILRAEGCSLELIAAAMGKHWTTIRYHLAKWPAHPWLRHELVAAGAGL